MQTKGLSSLPIPHSDENCYRFNWANLLPNCVSIRDKYKTAGSSRFCVISLTYYMIDLCVLCVFVVRSTPSLLRNAS
ncbi:MAG: hypothetical protein DWQ53_16390 [Microcystis flos-aquae DF17]|nr:MAG: hypothetical protein DWQ53_16390 [Microcystis flos-aquae DF17]